MCGKQSAHGICALKMIFEVNHKDWVIFGVCPVRRAGWELVDPDCLDISAAIHKKWSTNDLEC